MSLFADRELVWMIGGILVFLSIASLIAWVLKARARSESAQATVAEPRTPGFAPGGPWSSSSASRSPPAATARS